MTATVSPREPIRPDRLNLGCGEDYRDGWHNVDYNDRYRADELVDLREPWPDRWRRGFSLVLASHVFEHLPDLDHAFQQAARVLRPGGALDVRVPIGANAHTDWTHEHVWTYDTPLQFDQDWDDKAPSYQFDPSHPFRLVERDLHIWGIGPAWPLTPVLQLVSHLWPGVWTTTVPFSSGELRAVFRRLPKETAGSGEQQTAWARAGPSYGRAPGARSVSGGPVDD